jgi:Zn-dependent M28 family amino/carboxypeptidase
MRKRIISLLPLLLLPGLLAITGCSFNKENPDITTDELFQHISYLASDSLKGRLPGTEEDQLAALYIADEFSKAGLQLMADGGLQAFEVITDLETGATNYLRIGEMDAGLSEDFAPFPFTANKESSAAVVFAGYGFEIDKQEVQWNDYAGLDVTDKWVMVLRGNAEIDSMVSAFHAYSNDRDKAMMAGDKGAAGILFVSGPNFDHEDKLISLERREGKVSIPAIHISRKTADLILSTAGTSTEDMENKLNTSREPSSFGIDMTVSAGADVQPTTTTTYNVIAYLKGSNPETADKHIVIGAHYDHLGLGGMGSSSRKPDTTAAHNGADDNASGVAVLLEIAEALSLGSGTASNSYLFIAFGAEEMGLLGSKHYVNNPVLPLEEIRVMINLDMVGRLRNQQLLVGGVGTARESEEIVTRLIQHDSLVLSTNMEGFGASDHSSFYGEDIPVLFLTTGAHTDYHTPEDDIEHINLEGMVSIADYTSSVAQHIDQMNTALTYQEAGPKVRFQGRRGMRITLGITPDYTDNDDIIGMRVDFVTPGKQAHIGGMKKGDFIMAIEGQPVNGIYDYMYRLKSVNKGQIIVVTVKRNELELDLLVQL